MKLKIFNYVSYTTIFIYLVFPDFNLIYSNPRSSNNIHNLLYMLYENFPLTVLL